MFIAVTFLVIGVTACQKYPKYVDNEHPYYVGFRRSQYGQQVRSDEWWVASAKDFVNSLPNVSPAIPAIIEIVSGYNFEMGGTQFDFRRPADYTGPTEGMKFIPRMLDHERALSLYDKEGVKAIIQFEPGNVDVIDCIEMAEYMFGHHECIIGYGVDAEWFFQKETPGNTGRPITDEEAERWMKKVLEIDPEYTLFIKHWDPLNLPENYRHPNLWFLSDSQIFTDLGGLINDFEYWGNTYNNDYVGYQYGYKSDKKWWGEMKRPHVEITQEILATIPKTRYLFWVDFTAAEVEFWN